MTHLSDMRVLTVKQPWVWAILNAGKNIENRTWSTEYRGKVAIHAALRWSPTAYATSTPLQYEYERFGMTPFNVTGTDFPVGAILGTVDLVDVVTDSRSRWAMQDHFHWVLANPKKLDQPILFRGGLGLRHLPNEIAELLS